jgi:predicted SAM-dependent methyltransferase
MSKPKQPRKIHLGCGDKRMPGFINIDTRPTSSTDLVCDMSSLPFEIDSLKIVYMCHSLEHIPINDIAPLLNSIYSKLIKGGQIYISVPDFTVLSALYLSGRAPLSMIVRAIHGGQEYPGNTHYMSYDYDLLSTLLTKTGFDNISRYDPTDFLPLGFSDTSQYKIAGKKISLNVKASK